MYGMTTFTKSYHHVMLDKDHRMTKPMKEVYCFLLSFQETESISQIFPSTQKIAEFTCNSDRTVKRATKALQDIGLIQKTRRFNSSSIFKVMPYATKDAGATQSLTIGPHSPEVGATVSSYKITDKTKDKISLKEEGQSQNNEASLSQDNSLSMEDDFIGDKSDSDLIDYLTDSKDNSEEIPLDREEMVTDTYDSMPSEYDFEDEPDLTDDDDDESYSQPVGLNTPQQQSREISFANRVTAFNRKPNNHRY